MNQKKYILIAKASLRLSLLLISFKAFTLPENLTSLIITAESKIDICCATLNSKIDQINAPIQADFDGTFTVLATILASEQSDLLSTFTLINKAVQEEGTTQSKIDLCCYTLNSKIDSHLIDISNTQTVLNSIYEQDITLESKLDSCCSLLDCNPIPLVLNPSGNGIFQPGHYCVVNDVTFGPGASISIFSDNVVLDLNNHIITGSNFFSTITTQNADQVTIKNGTLINGTNGLGMNLAAGKNIRIENIDSTGGDVGIFAGGNSNVYINKVTCRGYAMHGFSFSQPINCTFENCKAYNGLAGTNGFTVEGFVSTTESSASLINCISNNNQIGFNIIDVQNAYLNSCSAYNNSLHGFQIHKTKSFAENATIFNCITERNQNGFNILVDPLISQPLNIYMKNCQANHNGNGYQIFDNIGELSGVITECIANRNSNIGFITFNIMNINSRCVVTNCVASCNFEGFSSASKSFVFYNNEASDNTIRNYGIPSAPDSADVKLFYDPLNGRGDNLASKLP